jgi:hypothetical protein
VAQDEQRGLVAPVDVVEDDDQAAAPGGDRQHRLGQVVEDPEPVLGDSAWPASTVSGSTPSERSTWRHGQ